MAELRIPIIGEFKGKKAFADAEKSTGKLDKGVKKLGAALIAAFSIQKITQFGKAAAKAFVEDEKAATRLSQSVKNLGLAFETPRIEEFITKMANATGVTDDQLRPAMQRLLQTTGSVTKSQELLTQALDVSRGSGVDYETVVNDLSMAYVGQTRGLRKYSLGVTQAELKTMSFAEVQERLNKNFSGANAAYLETYAGQMGILSNAAGEASEIIGKGLMDSLMILSGDTSVEELAITMETLASNTSNAITEIAKLGKSVANFFTESYGKADSLADRITDFLDRLTGNSERITRRNVGRAGRSFGGGSGGAGRNIETPEEKAQRLKREAAEAAAAKRNKELAALQKKSLDTQKKSLALQKASKTINLDAIGIEAALKGKINETDRLSLELQKAILAGNATLATQLSDQLEAAIKRNNELRLALLATPKAPNPFSEWSVPKLDFGGNMLGTPLPQGFTPPSYPTPAPVPQGPKAYVAPTPTIPEFNNFGDYLRLGPLGGLAAGVIAGVNMQPPVNVTVTLDGKELTSIITDTQINDSLSGSFGSVNRSGFKGAVAI
jgi:hypothetical protein